MLGKNPEEEWQERRSSYVWGFGKDPGRRMAGAMKLLRMRLWKGFRKKNGRSVETLTHEALGKIPGEEWQER